MIVFYILLMVPLLLQHIAVPGIGYQKKNRFALWCFFALLLLLLIFRHRIVGNDTINYIHKFKQLINMMPGSADDFRSEYGFVLWCRAVALVSREPQFFLAVSAAVYLALIGRTYLRLCSDAGLTITLFCVMSIFVMLFSGIRQAMAMGIGMAAYECVRHRQRLRFVLLVLLACSFHNSALVLLALYPVYYANITKKWLYVVVPVLLALFVLNGPIFNFLLAILSRFTRFDMAVTETGAYAMLLLFALLAVFSYVIPDEQAMDEEAKGLRNILLLAVAMQMFAPLHPLAMRVNYYFVIFIPILIPRIIHFRKQGMRQVALLGRHVLVLLMLVYFFGVLAPSRTLQVFPYRFFWEKAVW